jgi:hypothetical protein
VKGNRLLAVVSAVQLGAGVAGMALAIRRRHAFDIPFWHGRESAVGRDSLLMGTAAESPIVIAGASLAAVMAGLGLRSHRAAAKAD